MARRNQEMSHYQFKSPQFKWNFLESKERSLSLKPLPCHRSTVWQIPVLKMSKIENDLPSFYTKGMSFNTSSQINYHHVNVLLWHVSQLMLHVTEHSEPSYAIWDGFSQFVCKFCVVYFYAYFKHMLGFDKEYLFWSKTILLTVTAANSVLYRMSLHKAVHPEINDWSLMQWAPLWAKIVQS